MAVGHWHVICALLSFWVSYSLVVIWWSVCVCMLWCVCSFDLICLLKKAIYLFGWGNLYIHRVFKSEVLQIISLEHLYGEDSGLSRWVIAHTVPWQIWKKTQIPEFESGFCCPRWHYFFFFFWFQILLTGTWLLDSCKNLIYFISVSRNC